MKPRVSNMLQVFALLALVVLIFGMALCASGCTSTPKPPPPPVKVPSPCVIAIAPLPAAALPEKPAYPHDADEGELKAWALKLGEVMEQRETILLARDAAWFEKVTANNGAIPWCADAVPPIP